MAKLGSRSLSIADLLRIVLPGIDGTPNVVSGNVDRVEHKQRSQLQRLAKNLSPLVLHLTNFI